ncbi:CotH kinase family protein [Croceitalea sp. MTPC5]|uniref:CotH kinase family protein n=1 Tax=Croceitalea sp. MTPC5 TaxID=3056565 RepID=UPI0030CEB7A1
MIVLSITNTLFSQTIVPKKGSYGVDDKNKIIVWHNSNLDSLTAFENNNKIEFNAVYQLPKITSKLSYNQSYELKRDNSTFHLYITRLPVVKINFDTVKLVNNKKTPGYLTYYNENKFEESVMGIRQRGNLSLTFPKKSYDIEVWKDSLKKESKDVKFKGLRSDDDWILDGLYNEPLRLRSTVATKMWTDFHKPYYLDKEPKAVNGFGVKFVELFRNGEYLGLYGLSESVDRKQLRLKKNDGTKVFGELFKANSYEGGTSFKKAGEYNNIFPHYLGFRMEYPVIDYNSHWNNLSALLDLVVNQSDDSFIKNIGRQIDISNTIDYFIYVNLLRATDNLGKNYYLAKYDAKEPYFFVPWDVDGTFGVILKGKRISTTNDILSNNLFDRLLRLNPNGFNEKLKLRWQALRADELNDKNIFKRFTKYYERFNEEKIYEREFNRWAKDTTNDNDYDYLNKWISDRLAFLDDHFNKL